MGKKKSRAQYTSNGSGRNVSKSIRNVARREYLTSVDRIINQQQAFAENKNVMVTIPNPNKRETNKPFIRVTAKDAGWKKPEAYRIKQE